MIRTPDRIAAAIAAVERGEQVDWRKLYDLQALDLVQAGRKFAEEAAALDYEYDTAFQEMFDGR